ncbi:LCP family protein [Blautia sp.]|uniref:LCP family protein n=1 Tax=Blautia sp. TaxID=1955243 RepID=UPI003AB17B7B
MAKKNKSVRRRRKRRVLFGIELFVLLILVGGLFIYAKVNEKMNKLNLDNNNSEEASQVEVNEDVIGSKTLKGFTNIALFGVDNREEDVKSGQSDTTIIASINNDTKEVKLVSLYRDTYVNIGNDKYTRCNAAYNNGGPTQAMSMINTNLDLNITNYVAVNFKALATAIDCLGGLDVEMTYVEIKNMNDYCVETSEVTGMDYEPIEMPEYPGDDKQESEILGTFHLNGVQATSYCRIRYTSGWDMKRTERQRYIISLIVEKAKKASLSTLNDIMDQVFPMIATDFSKSELIKLGMGILSYKLGETSGFPTSNIMGEEVKRSPVGQDYVIPTTLETNVKALHQFLFGDENYEPSETVKQRSDYIAGFSGFGNAYVSDEQKGFISERASTYDGSSLSQSSSGTSIYSDTDDSDYSDYSDYSDSGSSDYSSGGSSDYSDSGSYDYNDSGSSDYGDSGSSDYNSGDDYNDSGDSGESGNNYDNGYEGSGDDGSGSGSSGESGDGYNNEDDNYSE